MNTAGDPTAHWVPNIPYDFGSLGAAVDVLEPEGYGRIGDWEDVKPGFFTQTYARWACPDLPMIWAEAGLHAWDMAAMAATDEMLVRQAAFYEDFYRMMVESRADGIFWWWYPGGFRANEKSDYGILNADGSDRPVSKVIREWGPKLMNGPDPKPITTWIDMKRDIYGDGLCGIYDDVKDEYWAAMEAGETPGLRTAGTGTTSADCPLMAVGGNPCNGNNPPMYLDGYFDLVERDKDAGVLRLTLTNTGEATWLAEGEGAVRVVDAAGAVLASLPHAVARYESITLELPGFPAKPVSITLDAQRRVRFGQVITIP
jgi:hypothetical protein